MNYFWDENVEMINAFSAGHYFYLICAVILLILLIVNRDFVKKHAESFRIGILLTSIGQQILLYSWYFLETGFDVSEALPIHISRISTILGIVYLFTKNEKILNVLFYWSVYAYGSFLYPTDIHPPYHAIGISFFVNHVITLMLPIFATIAYDWKPKLEGIKSAFGWFLIYLVAVYLFNPLVDGNYFYLEERIVFQNMNDLGYQVFNAVAALILFGLYYGVYTFTLKSMSKIYHQTIKVSK